MVNQTNVWRLYNVSAGQLLEIPAGAFKVTTRRLKRSSTMYHDIAAMMRCMSDVLSSSSTATSKAKKLAGS
jgi:hypothetical protein